MFGFQTLTCLHNIPVVRSSTNKLQDVYAKAKNTSVFIRLPCSVAETVADKSLQIALTIANPLVKPLRGSVRVIDDFAAQKIRQIESKYPAINTPTEDVVHTLSEKTEPVRNAINSVKDTTSSTIQHGKETVSNAATATVNKASGVADSVFSRCGLRIPGFQRRNMDKTTGLMGCTFSPISSFYNYVFQMVQSSLIWFRMLVVFFLLKIKQINDIVLHKIQQKTFLTTLPQRLLIFIGGFLDYFVARIRPDDRTLAELKKTKQQSRLSQQPHFVVKKQSSKAEPSVTTRQGVVVTQQETVITRTSNVNVDRHSQPDYSHLTGKEELYARLTTGASRPSAYNVDDNTYITETVDLVDSSNDIAQLHAQLKPTDVELLYSRLPSNILSDVDNQEALNEDQQTLHARLIGAELERQGYQDGE